MTRIAQKDINTACVQICELFHESVRTCPPDGVRRLRQCTAKVYRWQSGNCVTYALKSYDTFVALVIRDGERTACYDFLRYVYGYTATSAQHIAKFFSDYADKTAERFRYYAK